MMHRIVHGMMLLCVAAAAFSAFCNPVRTHGQGIQKQGPPAQGSAEPKYTTGVKSGTRGRIEMPALVRIKVDTPTSSEYGWGWVVKNTPEEVYILTITTLVKRSQNGKLQILGSLFSACPITIVPNQDVHSAGESKLTLLKVDVHLLSGGLRMRLPSNVFSPSVGDQFRIIGPGAAVSGTVSLVTPYGEFTLELLPGQNWDNELPGSMVAVTKPGTTQAAWGILFYVYKFKNTGHAISPTTITHFLLGHGISWGDAGGENKQAQPTGLDESGSDQSDHGTIPSGIKPPVEAIVPDKAVVRIFNKTSMKQGTGFIVRLDQNETWILTASHVIQGDNSPQIEFYGHRGDLVAGTIISKEEDDLTGLAIVKVKQSLSPDLVALPLSKLRLNVEDEVKVLGFPRNGTSLQHALEHVRSREGRNIKIGGDPLSEGFSGSPVIKDGKVVGMVMSIEEGSNIMPAAQLLLFWEGVIPDKPLTP